MFTVAAPAETLAGALEVTRAAEGYAVNLVNSPRSPLQSDWIVGSNIIPADNSLNHTIHVLDQWHERLA
jgi:hypothetical protein